MKFISLLVAMMMTFSSMAQVISPEKIQKDTLQLGRASSGLSKEIIFDTGDGASNKKMSVDGTSKILSTNASLTVEGDLKVNGKVIESTISNQELTGNSASIEDATGTVFNITGSSLVSIACLESTINGRKALIVNNTGKQILIKNSACSTAAQGFLTGVGKDIKIKDGGSISIIYNNIVNKWIVVGGTGSGGGGGSAGVNILNNPSFEDGIINYTAGNLAEVTQIAYTNKTEFEENYGRFTFPVTSGGYVKTDLYAIPDTTSGQCQFKFKYKTSADSFKVEVFDELNNLKAEEQYTDVEVWTDAKSINFPCEAGEQFSIYFNGVENNFIDIDQLYFGDHTSLIQVYDNSPVGTVVPSLLTESQFQSELGTHWVLADGRNVTGTRFASLFGSNTLPDMRGVFLRGKDNGAGKDSERALGNYQTDAFQGHQHGQMFGSNAGHNIPENTTASTGGTYQSSVGNASGYFSGNFNGYQVITSNIYAGSNGTPRTDNETRPKNVTVNYFIKINGKSISAVSEVGYALRAGQIITGAFSVCPANTLEADGRQVSRTKYSQLFSALGTSHGQGDGSTTFNLPDYRGQFLRGRIAIANVTGSGSVASNQATFTNHGFNRTGLRVRLASGTLSGLAASTNYYVIVVDANTLAFATTRANALANTRIAISGTNTAVIQQWEDTDAATRLASNVGGNTGTNVGSIQEDELKSHTHTYPYGGGSVNADPYLQRANGFISNRETSSAGGNETRPSNVYVKYCVQTSNTDIAGTFRQIDDFEARFTEKFGTRYIVKTWNSGSNWYEVYNDGWVRQTIYAGAGANSVNFHITMRDTDYTGAPHWMYSGSGSTNQQQVGFTGTTTTSVSFSGVISPGIRKVYIEGFGNSSAVSALKATPNY